MNRTEHLIETLDETKQARAESIGRVLSGGFRALRFPTELETLFEERQRASRDRHLIVMSLLGIVVQNCFLFTDWLLIPDVFQQALVLRLGWITAFLLGGVGLMTLRPPVWFREGGIAIGTLTVVAAILHLSSISSAPTAIYHPTGLALIPMFGSIAFRLRFWYALGLSLLTFAAVALFIHPQTPMDRLIALTDGMVLGFFILLSLLACYMLEHQERRNFLLTELDRYQRDALTAANAYLHDLTTLDPLTGIYNRRQFEAVLKVLWAQAVHSGRPLALVIIDVDAFKSYNDRYGHPEGDLCLKRVAGSLSSVIRREGTMVARIGGDEFAALAIGLDAAAALSLGEKLHEGVAALAIPHLYSPVTSVVSLSIGAASLRPQTWENPQDLIDLADRAVYAAKAAGRNCVRGNAGPAPQPDTVAAAEHSLTF